LVLADKVRQFNNEKNTTYSIENAQILSILATMPQPTMHDHGACKNTSRFPDRKPYMLLYTHPHLCCQIIMRQLDSPKKNQKRGKSDNDDDRRWRYLAVALDRFEDELESENESKSNENEVQPEEEGTDHLDMMRKRGR